MKISVEALSNEALKTSLQAWISRGVDRKRPSHDISYKIRYKI